jgi:uncharacterized protein DUF1064
MDWTRFAEHMQANGEPWDPRPGAVNVVTADDVRAGRCSTPIIRSKYRNRAVLVDGYRFDSGLEADRYLELKTLQTAGTVLWFTRQVPFQLAQRVTYRADFLVVWRCSAELQPEAGGQLVRITVEDTKGWLTETARVKLAMVEKLYGVMVRLLRRSDVKRMRA